VRPIRFTIVAVGLWAVAVCSCEKPRESTSSPTEPPAKPARNYDAELAAMRLSKECQDSAAAFWHREGYDRPTPAAKNVTENRGYQSHYNVETKRCLILVDLTTIQASGVTTKHQEVFDAIEGGAPLATLHKSNTFSLGGREFVDVSRGNQALESNVANIEWFEGLMKK
jgi:hypothetical protein